MPEQKKTMSMKKKASNGIGIPGLFILYSLLSFTFFIAATYFGIIILSADLPDHQQFETKIVKQPLSTFIYSSDNEQLRTLAKMGEGKSFWTPFSNIPNHTIDAFIAAEDSRFYQHWGVSLLDFIRANIVNLQASRFGLRKEFPFFFKYVIKQGGSTITQQLARTIFLDRKQTIKRKLKEWIVAIKIEHSYSKSEILEFFLNRMDFGHPFIGIQTASKGYFGKDTSELNIGESAVLAGILNATTRYNPRRGEKGLVNARARRNTVLGMMVNIGRLSQAAYREEREKPIILSSGTVTDYGKAPYFVQYVEDQLNERYGYEAAHTEGFRVYTTLDYRLQQIAEEALENRLDIIQKNYADHLKYKRPFGLTDTQAVKDSTDRTVVQGALIALDVKTGKILAMLGGREFDFFNRSTVAERHAGSLFKPFVYTAALDNGWRCSDVIRDSPIAYRNPDGTYWEPDNFTNDNIGPLSLRDGFKTSRNIIAIKLMNDTENRGIGPGPVVQYARKMGITTPLNPVPSLAIGTSPVRLIEMVAAYTIFPNHGIKTQPFAIDRINDKNAALLFRQPNGEGAKSEALNTSVASLMLTMFESVTKEGTASNILRYQGMSSLPCGGKTGTGNEYKDAWFIGFTPHIACGVWIGFDSEETTLGGNTYGTGATATLPVWIEFMRKANELYGYGEDRFTYDGIIPMQLCRDSYKRVSATCPEERKYTEFFLQGTEITDFCDIHGKKRRGF